MYRCIPQIKYSKKDINTQYFDHYPVVKYKDILVSYIYLYISVYICIYLLGQQGDSQSDSGVSPTGN